MEKEIKRKFTIVGSGRNCEQFTMLCPANDLDIIDRILSKITIFDDYKIYISTNICGSQDVFSSLEYLQKEKKYKNVAKKHIARLDKSREQHYKKFVESFL